MSRNLRSTSMTARAGLLALGAFTVVTALGASASGAWAQAGSCGDVQKFLTERKSIADRITSRGKKQIEARFACTQFSHLVTNGTGLVKWIDANKDWCQIPDSFISGVKADHAKAISLKGQACGVAAKQAKMERQAREGGGGGGLLGGMGLSGQSRIPQGAL